MQLYYHCLMSSINLQGSNQGSTHFLFCAALLSLLDVIYWSSRQQPGLHSFSVLCSSTIIAWCHLLIFKESTRAATHFLFCAALYIYYHCLMSSINLQGSNQGSTHFLFCAALLSLLDVIYWSSRQQPGLPLIFYLVQLYYHCLMSSINLQGINQGCHSFSILCSSTIIAWCHLLIFKAATRAPLIFYFVQLYYHCLMSSIDLQGSNQGSTHFLFRAALLSLLDVIY